MGLVVLGLAAAGGITYVLTRPTKTSGGAGGGAAPGTPGGPPLGLAAGIDAAFKAAIANDAFNTANPGSNRVVTQAQLAVLQALQLGGRVDPTTGKWVSGSYVGGIFQQSGVQPDGTVTTSISGIQDNVAAPYGLTGAQLQAILQNQLVLANKYPPSS